LDEGDVDRLVLFGVEGEDENELVVDTLRVSVGVKEMLSEIDADWLSDGVEEGDKDSDGETLADVVVVGVIEAVTDAEGDEAAVDDGDFEMLLEEVNETEAEKLIDDEGVDEIEGV